MVINKIMKEFSIVEACHLFSDKQAKLIMIVASDSNITYHEFYCIRRTYGHANQIGWNEFCIAPALDDSCNINVTKKITSLSDKNTFSFKTKEDYEKHKINTIRI